MNPPAHVGPDHLGAFFTPPETHTPAQTAALKASDAYIAQLFDANVVVLGTPMHNFGISSTLKSWVDNIVRVGKTFRYSETGPIGLIPGKRFVLVVGSGGFYSDGPYKLFEHAAHYLRDILLTLGGTEFTILRAEGSAMGPEAAARAVPDGVAAARKAAAES